MQTLIALLAAATVSATSAPPAQTHPKQIALTFDDCPRKTSTLMTGMERAKKLTQALKENNVHEAAFFCNSPSRAPDGPQRIQHFADQGHVIANHSATHPDFNKTPIEKYMKDIDQGHKDLAQFPNFKKWFRYPYLHEGKTNQDRNAIRALLAKLNYKNAYVTIDTADYYLDDLLLQAVAKKQKYDVHKLCAVYKDHMLDQAEFHDDLSAKALGRSVKHVILMHETDLNALCLSDLIKELRHRGWEIITVTEAFTDEIANREPNTLFLGQGRVAALAKEKGYKGKLFSKWIEESDIEKEFERRGVFK